MNNALVSDTASVIIRRFSEKGFSDASDCLAVEAPLEISVCLQSSTGLIRKNVGTTLRTPGQDGELAIGYLFSLGIIKSRDDIESVSIPNSGNERIELMLRPHCAHELDRSQRFGIMNAGCGICGISSLEAMTDLLPVRKPRLPLLLDQHIIMSLTARIREQQQLFGKTGGIHAAALFSPGGDLVLIREDIGRHNALDKLIGCALYDVELQLQNHILLLSGRAGFELIQKTAMAGIPVVVSVGAPSALAVEMAKDGQITLIGFLRENRFNLYSEFDKWHQDET